MARVEVAPEAFDDFDRFFDHLALFEVDDASERIGEIVQAVQIQAHSPLIGYNSKLSHAPLPGTRRKRRTREGRKPTVSRFRSERWLECAR